MKLAALLKMDRSELERSEFLSEDAFRYLAELMDVPIQLNSSVTECIQQFAEALTISTGEKIDAGIYGHICAIPTTIAAIYKDYGTIQDHLRENPGKLEKHKLLGELINKTVHPMCLQTTIPMYFGAFPEAQAVVIKDGRPVIDV